MKFFDFWAFRKKWQKLSHGKIMFHMLFGAFQNTPRKLYYINQIMNYNIINYNSIILIYTVIRFEGNNPKDSIRSRLRLASLTSGANYEVIMEKFTL